MFDLRYHIASLAAVFIAIAVGIVIGVAIASGDKVPKTTLNVLNGQKASLENQLQQQGSSLRDSRSELSAATTLLEGVYPQLMAGRLAGRAYAVLYLGDRDDDARKAIEDTLDSTGAGRPMRATTIALPFDAKALSARVKGDASFTALTDLAAIGHELGREFADGEDSLWSVVRQELVEESSGPPDPAVDGVIVVGKWVPDPANDARTKASNDAVEQLIDGLLQGIESTGRTVVGVESFKGDGETTTLGSFEGLSTVNDVDLLPGRVALGLLLSGTVKPGHYGISAPDGVVPTLPPLTVVAATTTGGG